MVGPVARARPHQRRYAREMRRRPTWAEFRLWQALKGSQLGVKFRRQHPIGPYIVDFVCLPERVIVEADGRSHDDGGVDDAIARDRHLRERGFAVLHNDDAVITHALDDALSLICAVLADPEAQWDSGPSRD